VGRSGAISDLAQLEIRLQDLLVYQGQATPFDAAAVSRALDARDVLVSIALGAGEGRGLAWGCDLSEEYVRINADYTT
jgi:glutamate N-acetyltransferase/amino-acid N-acetyltransferase